jgi:predicted  nucleic acid-binding Zn-ribbon protein
MHLQRVLQKLTTARATAGSDVRIAALDAAIDAIEDIRERARTARGEARAALLDRLEAIDADLVAQVRASLAVEALDALVKEAETDLAAFSTRITREAHAQAVAAATERLIRTRAGLPRITYTG